MCQLLEVDHRKRLSAFEAANHAWLGGLEQAQAARDEVSASMQAREFAATAEKAASMRAVRKKGRRVCRVTKAQPHFAGGASGAGAAAANGSVAAGATAAGPAATAAPTPLTGTPGEAERPV